VKLSVTWRETQGCLFDKEKSKGDPAQYGKKPSQLPTHLVTKTAVWNLLLIMLANHYTAKTPDISAIFQTSQLFQLPFVLCVLCVHRVL
jgi:hypothetical protein